MIGTIIIIILVLLALCLCFILGVLLDLAMGKKVKHPALPEGTLKTSFNNSIEYFTSGRQLFDSMKQSIAAAKDHIHLSFFIFKGDTFGTEMMELLKSKAKQGITVRLLVDSLNSSGLRKHRRSLEAAGIHLAFSAKPSFPFTFYYLNRRNHRKIAVIDGTIGYFGGFNVGDEYIDNDSTLGSWHDNHVKLNGEGVRDLQDQFIADWQAATREKTDKSRLYPPPAKGPIKLTLLATYGKQLEDVFIEKLAEARKSIVIGSPYFIPSKRLQNLLADRLDHGVQLTILLPAKKDHPFVKPASYHYLTPLVEKGARLYHFYQGFYHSKVFIVDDKLCYIGTANFDQRSFFWNDELSGFIDDQALIAQISESLKEEMALFSEAITIKNIHDRSGLEKIKTFFSIWLSPLL